MSDIVEADETGAVSASILDPRDCAVVLVQAEPAPRWRVEGATNEPPDHEVCSVLPTRFLPCAEATGTRGPSGRASAEARRSCQGVLITATDHVATTHAGYVRDLATETVVSERGDHRRVTVTFESRGAARPRHAPNREVAKRPKPSESVVKTLFALSRNIYAFSDLERGEPARRRLQQ